MIYLVEICGQTPGDRLPHWTRAESHADAIEKTKAEMWGAVEATDRYRASGPYEEMPWTVLA